jgi:hypothetical protein
MIVLFWVDVDRLFIKELLGKWSSYAILLG